MFEFLRRIPPPIEETRIELPAVTAVFNHKTKTAWLFCDDAKTDEASLIALEKHLGKRGYHLQVFIGAPDAIVPTNREL